MVELCCRPVVSAKVFIRIALIAVIFFLGGFPALAINSPTITSVAGKAVAPATIMYANSNSFQVRGNAEANTTITLLRGAGVASTTTTAGDGVWVINLLGQPEGSFDFTAVAFDGIFTSEPSVVVPVTIDWTAPVIDIWYGNSGCRSNATYQCSVGLYYALVSDGLTGVDFSTGQFLIDYAAMPTTGDPDLVTSPAWLPCPGTMVHDGLKQINFSPSDSSLLNQPFRKIRLRASVSDKAGNVGSAIETFYMHHHGDGLINRPPVPEITEIKDGAIWKPYVSGMTVTNNPITVRGKVAKWNLENRGWYSCAITDNTNGIYRNYTINQSTGVFELSYAKPFPEGAVTLMISSCDSADCLGRHQAVVNLVTTYGTPFPIVSYAPSYPGAELKVIGSRLLPNYTGTVARMNSNQTVQFGWSNTVINTVQTPLLSQVVLPLNTNKSNTSAYDLGDIWYDADNDGAWDPGEAYFDVVTATPSDGQSFSLINFMNWQYPANECQIIGGETRNAYGRSTAVRIVRAHHNDAYPPLLNSLAIIPVHDSAFRKSALKPSQFTIKAQTWSGDYAGSRSWSPDFYDLVGANSNVIIVNNLGVQVPGVPAPIWVELNKLAFEGTLNLSTVSFAEGTYQIRVRLEDQMQMVTQNNSNWFMIDNTPPAVIEQVPSNNELSNSYTSFSARLLDPDHNPLTGGDGSPGSGVDIDVLQPQLWPYRSLAKGVVTANNKADWIFDLTDAIAFPKDHLGNNLLVNTAVEIWPKDGATILPTQLYGKITVATGNAKVTVMLDSGLKYTNGVGYEIVYRIPFFTSNNGIDKVGAVPIKPITADGVYLTRVVSRDRAGNTGTFFSTSSSLEIASGPISFLVDKPFLFAGLLPADVGTFTTSSVLTSKGFVRDGQSLSLVQNPNNLTMIFPPDANGIPGDGHQILFGKNGAPTGVG